MPDVTESIDIDFTQPVPPVTGGLVYSSPTPVAPIPASGDPFLMMIERAASDPRVDIDKMERLFRMKLEHDASRAKTAYLQALALMQPDLPVITKNGVISKNEKGADGRNTGKQEAMTKYAKWEDVVEGITPVLAQHGFSLSFRVAQPTEARVAVSGVLGHKDGHTEETTLALPIDSSGAKNNVQGWGSSVSYGKRYTAFALLNISARGEDDDGGPSGDDDIERLGTGPRHANGERMSNYDAKAAEKAKLWADAAIQTINLTNNAEAVREWARVSWTVPAGKKKSPLQWLSDNSPGQFLRVQQCYQNVTGEDLE